MIITAPGGGRSIIMIIIGIRLEKFLGYVDLSIGRNCSETDLALVRCFNNKLGHFL